MPLISLFALPKDELKVKVDARSYSCWIDFGNEIQVHIPFIDKLEQLSQDLHKAALELVKAQCQH